MRRFLRVGLTGGIGSGKTTIAQMFEQLGRPVIYADDVARQIAEGVPEAKGKIASLFGPGAYDTEGRLNSRMIASIAFENKDLLAALNSVLHPLVIAEVKALASTLEDAGRSPFLVVEAALIVESGLLQYLNALIVVRTTEALRIDRVVKRDDSSRTDVVARIRAQLPPREIEKHADFIIDNDGSVEELRPRVEFVDTILSRMAGWH